MSTHIEFLTVLAQMYQREHYKPRYLELGAGDGGCFDSVAMHCSRAVAVDVPENPYGNGRINFIVSSMRHCHFYDCGSDDFFARWDTSTPDFDLIFIDGSHWAEQVERDVAHSLDALRPNGTIVLHDTWAPTMDEATQGSDTAYLVAEQLERDPYLQTFTLPIRPGLTLLRPDIPRFQ